MAVLGEHVRLSTGEKGDLLGYIARGSSEKTLIVTRSNKHVRIYDVNDPRPLNSWATDSGQNIQHGAIINPTTGECTAIINKQTIRRWNADDTTIKKGKKFTLTKRADRLLSPPTLQPIILYMDGTVAWLNKAGEIRGREIVKESEEIIWVDTVQVEESIVVALLKSNEGKSSPTCYVYVAREAKDTLQQTELEFQGNWNNSSRCLCTIGSRVVLFSLDHSTGELTEIEIHGPAFGMSKPVGKLPIDPSTNIGICSLSPTQIAVFGVRSNENKGFGVWDTKFGLLQSWKPFPDSKVAGNKSVQLLRLPLHVIVNTKDGLYAFPYQVQQSTLSASMGKFRSSTFKTEESNKTVIVKSLEQLSDPKETNTSKKFSLVLESFLKNWNDSSSKDVYSIQHYLEAIVKRILSEEKLWSRNNLQALLQQSLIPNTICAELIRTLIGKKDIVLLHVCISNLRDISEDALAHCLNFYLSAEESDFTETKDQEMADPESEVPQVLCPFSASKAGFISKLLAIPYNDVFLLGHLKKMDFNNCIHLLKYLHHLLDTVPVGVTERSSNTLSVIQVVDWIIIVLDAHFTQLILSLEARQVLVNLHQTVEKNVHFFDELVGLENVLAQLKEKCTPPHKQNLGVYNIHVLHV